MNLGIVFVYTHKFPSRSTWKQNHSLVATGYDKWNHVNCCFVSKQKCVALTHVEITWINHSLIICNQQIKIVSRIRFVWIPAAHSISADLWIENDSWSIKIMHCRLRHWSSLAKKLRTTELILIWKKKHSKWNESKKCTYLEILPMIWSRGALFILQHFRWYRELRSAVTNQQVYF